MNGANMATEFRKTALLVGIVTGIAFAGSAWAQTAPEQEVTKVETRQADLNAQITANNAAIAAMNDPECPDVSFAEVLQDPDNVELNVCYARGQIGKGAVRSAAATLERVLLIAPDAINVRLLYAIVLFRLDSMDEAERQFLEVGEGELPPEIRAQVDEFLAEIDRRRQTVKHTVTVALGTYYDTNRNAAPQSGELLAAGVRADITNQPDRENGELGFLTLFGYDMTYDPGFQSQHEIFVGVDLFADTVTEQHKLDVQALNMDAGIRLRYPGFTLTPRAFLKNMRLDWGKFYQSEGIELRIDHRHRLFGLEEAWPPLDTWASYSVQDEDFHNTPNFQTLTLRNGNKHQTQVGLAMLVTPDHHISLTGNMEFKSAAKDPTNNDVEVFSYKYYNVEANHTWVLGDGHFLLSNLMMGVRQYKASDTLVVGATGVKRIEQPFRARVTYGMPLIDLVGSEYLERDTGINNSIQEFLDGMTISFSGEYNYQRSNITNFQYNDTRVGMLLTRSLDY